MICRVRRSLVVASCVAGAACFPRDVTVTQPGELAGRWARMRADQTWSDTLVLQADGGVIDPDPHPAQDTIRWAVVRSKDLGAALCIGVTRVRAKNHCLPYRLEGDTLVWGYGTAPTYFRRAH